MVYQVPAPLVGGFLLSFATSKLLFDQGRILGCSGIAHSTLSHLSTTLTNPPSKKEKENGDEGQEWKVSAALGLVVGGLVIGQLRPSLELVVGQPLLDSVASAGIVRPLLAGFAVGVGTKLARGCTSGHMLIGMARFSKRSIFATLTFFTTAFFTSRLFSYPLPSSTTSSIALLNLSHLTPSIISLFLIPITSSLLIHRILPSPSSHRLSNLVQSFSLSFVFSLGLALTGMLRPSKVLSFFYVPIPSTPSPSSKIELPPWDPSLALVALGGLLPNIVAWYTLMKGRNSPRRRDEWDVPKGGKVDSKLLLGSALFGIGWGLMGICPGPMMTVLGSGTGGISVSLFAGAFALGGFVVNLLS